MTGKLPLISADKRIALQEKKGFILVRQSGKSQDFRNSDMVRVTVPCHSGETLHPKILRQILTDAGIEPGEL